MSRFVRGPLALGLLGRFEPVKNAHYDGIRRRHALAQRTGFLGPR